MRSSSISALATLLAAVVSPVLAGTQEMWWNITYVDDVNPDGLYPRRVIGVNGTWPYVSLPTRPHSYSPTLHLFACSGVN